MAEISFTTLLIIFVILTTLDKGLTLTNVLLVQKNFPDAIKDDPFKIERNPFQKFLFEKIGLIKGIIAYFFIGIITMFIVYYLLKQVTPNYALYIIILAYSFVIMNNAYFLLKFSKVIP